MYENDEVDISGVGIRDIERIKDPSHPLNKQFVVAPRLDSWYVGFNVEVPFTGGRGDATQDWTDINQQLYSALMLEKIGMGIGIGLIVMVAALNIIASLILLVMEKTRDIAILKTMGASSRSITLIFLLQGTIIGVIGTVIGALAGAGLAQVLDRYRLITIPSDIYQVSYLPFRVLPGDLVAIILGAVVVCFVATLYPSRQAARLDPAQALRYE